jgi:hypothetical protein
MQASVSSLRNINATRASAMVRLLRSNYLCRESVFVLALLPFKINSQQCNVGLLWSDGAQQKPLVTQLMARFLSRRINASPCSLCVVFFTSQGTLGSKIAVCVPLCGILKARVPYYMCSAGSRIKHSNEGTVDLRVCSIPKSTRWRLCCLNCAPLAHNKIQ